MPEKLCIPGNTFFGCAVFIKKINTNFFFNFSNLKLTSLKKILTLNLHRIIALIVVLAGALGSLGIVLYTGRNNDSIPLEVLFLFWVISPFAALLIDFTISRHWSVLKRTTLYFLMLVISIGSLVAYSGALSPPGIKAAFVFLVVPLISWLLMLIVIPMVSLFTRRRSRRNNGDKLSSI